MTRVRDGAVGNAQPGLTDRARRLSARPLL
jgi:hypothetical protein